MALSNIFGQGFFMPSLDASRAHKMIVCIKNIMHKNALLFQNIA